MNKSIMKELYGSLPSLAAIWSLKWMMGWYNTTATLFSATLRVAGSLQKSTEVCVTLKHLMLCYECLPSSSEILFKLLKTTNKRLCDIIMKEIIINNDFFSLTVKTTLQENRGVCECRKRIGEKHLQLG